MYVTQAIIVTQNRSPKVIQFAEQPMGARYRWSVVVLEASQRKMRDNNKDEIPATLTVHTHCHRSRRARRQHRVETEHRPTIARLITGKIHPFRARWNKKAIEQRGKIRLPISSYRTEHFRSMSCTMICLS